MATLTPLKQVRLLIPDSGAKPMFSDEELRFLLSEHGDNPKLAAAEALDIIAGDPQRLASWSRGGVSATRPSADDLRKRAQQLREQVHGSVRVGTIVRTDFWE